MGYRNYISRIKKSDLPKLSLLDDYDFRRDMTEELHEIGKYYDHPDDEWEELYDFGDDDTEYKIITKKSLKAIIKQYEQSHLKYLQDLIKPDEELTEDDKMKIEFGYRDTPHKYVQKKIMEWERADSLVYDINDNSDRLVKSWAMEYEIFELIRIYKSFDEEKYYLVYEGH